MRDYRRTLIVTATEEDEQSAVAALAEAQELLPESIGVVWRRVAAAVDSDERGRDRLAGVELEVTPHSDGCWIARVDIDRDRIHRLAAVIGPPPGEEIARHLAEALLVAPLDAHTLRAALHSGEGIDVDGFTVVVGRLWSEK